MRYRAAIIAVMLAVISVLAGSVSAHAAIPHGGVPIYNAPVCGLNKFVRVKQPASEFTVHDSAGTCIESPQHHLAFQVTKIEKTLHWQYPNIASGYELGESSCASSRDTCYKYPVKQAQDGMPVASVGAWLAKGTYNLSFDAWFAPKPSQVSYTDRDGDTEIMIWLAHPGIDDTARLDWHATIDGKRWGVMAWQAGQESGHDWRYVAYLAPRTTLGSLQVNKLWLNPFFRDAEQHGSMTSGEWLTAIDLGFEIYQGGLHDNVHGYTLSGVR